LDAGKVGAAEILFDNRIYAWVGKGREYEWRIGGGGASGTHNQAGGKPSEVSHG
jgi:hypothetical protein